jgi:hypothetical protein
MSQGTLNLEQARHYRNQGYLKVNGESRSHQ